MKIRWQSGSHGRSQGQEVEWGTKCFSFMPVNSPLKDKFMLKLSSVRERLRKEMYHFWQVSPQISVSATQHSTTLQDNTTQYNNKKQLIFVAHLLSE